MPCYDPRSTDPEYVCEEVRKLLNRATRVACELAKEYKALLRHDYPKLDWDALPHNLSGSTLRWVVTHELFDLKRAKKKGKRK